MPPVVSSKCHPLARIIQFILTRMVYAPTVGEDQRHIPQKWWVCT